MRDNTFLNLKACPATEINLSLLCKQSLNVTVVLAGDFMHAYICQMMNTLPLLRELNWNVVNILQKSNAISNNPYM